MHLIYCLWDIFSYAYEKKAEINCVYVKALFYANEKKEKINYVYVEAFFKQMKRKQT